ncbi:hypothetical protein P3X46_003550 [Hevea brasiliensis]|uniref:Uncharacterized protein n=1 Tax=Hevea brasiliensis TaxID=3981 RepID=A0ABQ9N6K5_HEVBR|nr:uncharacterized protein At4g00950 [Hevea brasiliensis]KAJ9188161.1 hypothetical protein P3X46_003550 [Hevea brasiliensis]
MGSETEPELSSTPRLPLFLSPHAHAYVQSPQRSGMLTPPLYASASVPFRWEEEPGKPSGCTPLSNPIDFSPKCLELPPRLLLDANVNKLLSPTTVMKGPYMGKQRFQSSSFRMIRRECYGSFRRSCSPERGQLSTMVLSKRRLKDRGLLGSWRWGRRAFTGKREVGGASYVFPSFMDRDVEDSNKEDEGSNKNAKITRIRRSGSCSTRTRSRFWGTIYEGLKQVIPWRSKKLKKDGFVI